MRTEAMNFGLKTYSYRTIDYRLCIVYYRLRTIDKELLTEDYELCTNDLRQ